MCRWIAYRGEVTPFEQYVTQPVHSLIAQSLRARESSGSTNGDGFGLGWYGVHPEPGLYRETRPAWSDENLRYLRRHIRANRYYAHVHVSTGTPTMWLNCHPFACRRWLFMHNGQVGGYDRVRRRLENLVPDDLFMHRQGTTDSELFFLLLFAHGLEQDPVAALNRVTQLMLWTAREAEVSEPFRMTDYDLYPVRHALPDETATQPGSADIATVSMPAAASLAKPFSAEPHFRQKWLSEGTSAAQVMQCFMNLCEAGIFVQHIAACLALA